VTTADSPERATPPRARQPRRRVRKRRNIEATAATRVDILKSAARAFRKLGYHGATVEQIATALRMTKGNLYYYFKNKEDILFGCHQYSLDRLLQLLEEIEHSQLSPHAKVQKLIHGVVHTILDELHGTALFLELEALSPAHLRAVIVQRDRFDRGVRHVLEEGIASGSFAPGDTKLLSFAILGAINWIPRWFNPAGPSTSDEIANQFADCLIDGLRQR
jgi:TetR/AcrR family transcriptional regulator, cholesterol catabolism regulator